jgi:hypothetical protein
MRKLLGLCIVLCPTLLLLGCWANPDGPVATTVGDGSSGATASVRVYDGEGNEIDSPQLLEDRPDGDPVEIFSIGSLLAVYNGGKSPKVEFPKAYYLTEITTYHWNDSKGTTAGTIALEGRDGTTYGPWQAHTVNKVYWVANPGVTIPAGSYTVIDSDPGTWAQNAESGGKGMTWASGIPSE